MNYPYNIYNTVLHCNSLYKSYMPADHSGRAVWAKKCLYLPKHWDWVWIPLETCLSLFVYSVFVLSYVSSSLVMGWSSFKESCQLSIRLKKLNWNNVSQMCCAPEVAAGITIKCNRMYQMWPKHVHWVVIQPVISEPVLMTVQVCVCARCTYSSVYLWSDHNKCFGIYLIWGHVVFWWKEEEKCSAKSLPVLCSHKQKGRSKETLWSDCRRWVWSSYTVTLTNETCIPMSWHTPYFWGWKILKC